MEKKPAWFWNNLQNYMCAWSAHFPPARSAYEPGNINQNAFLRIKLLNIKVINLLQFLKILLKFGSSPTKETNDLWTQQRLQSTWAFCPVRWSESLPCTLWVTLYQTVFGWTAKALVRLDGCLRCRPESLLGFVMLWLNKFHMGCRFTIYSLFMDIQNSFLDMISIIHFWISKNQFMYILKYIFGYPKITWILDIH